MCSSGQITYKVHVIYAKTFSISINPLSLHNKQNFLSKTLLAFKLIGIFSSRYESSIGLKNYLEYGFVRNIQKNNNTTYINAQ